MISVIIPVFNSGDFLENAIASILKSNEVEFEIIIVNDGSNDAYTIRVLESLNHNSMIVLDKENGGPASARNFGATHATGDFLFFLDSDNLIHPKYFEKALNITKADSKVAVVYSNPSFFGSGASPVMRFESRAFDFDALLAGNYIDMCSMVRRDTFLNVGGFDEAKDLIGWEDWDLWIRIAQAGWRFHYLDEVLFDYRVREDSLMGSADSARREEMLTYLGNKHSFVIHRKYRQYFRVMDQIQEKPFRYFLKILYYKYVLRKPFIG